MFEHLDRLTLRLLLIVIDLPEIQNLPLHNTIAATTAILNNAPVPVFLAVLDTLRGTQKHAASLTETMQTSIG